MVRRIFLLVASLALASLTLAQNPQSKIKFLQAGSSNGNAVHQVTHRSRMVTTRGHRSQRATARSRLTAAQNKTLKSPTISSLLSALAPIPEYSLQGSVNLAPWNPELTAVDPFANHPSASDPLKPARPFWYAVDKDGITVLRLDNNTVLERIPWNFIPAGYTEPGISVIQPDGSFVTALPPAEGYQIVGMTVSYPTEEALASNSETPAAYVYVVVANSGFEWQSATTLPAGRDPNLRDTIVPSTNPATESSMLIQIDVTDPTLPLDDPAAPIAPLTGALLGHGAGQPAYDPSTGTIYVGNMPSTSLPTTPTVPVDLTSFVSVVAEIVGPEIAAAGEAGGAEAPPIILPLESPDVMPNTPLAWPFLAEGGEGPYIWEFQNLPSWLTPHADKITGQLDGIVYGTVPASGSWAFQVRATDMGAEPPLTSDWTEITMTANAAAEEQLAGELPFEAGAPNAVALAGTDLTGNPINPASYTCTLAATASPGSIVPAWMDAKAVPGGCVVIGTAPISGEFYEFTLSNFKEAYPWDREPVVFSGNVAGPYIFDPLPAGVGLSGLAWHEIDKIHDPSTEADILNVEFFGVEPFTGQLYQITPPQGALEVSGAVAPPEISVEPDKITALGDPLAASLSVSRPDIADALTANPTLKVRFGNLVVDPNRDPNIFVTAPEIADPTGTDPTVIPIGGPAGSTIADGALMKISGTRNGEDAAIVTLSAPSTINLPGMQASFSALDSDLSPAIRGEETGQRAHGVLWVTGTNTGNVAVVNTASGSYAQMLAVPSGTALGGVSCNFGTQSAYVAGKLLQNVAIFGTGAPPSRQAPAIWGPAEATFKLGAPNTLTLTATGSPTPEFSYTGTLPSGVTFVDNGNGTATLAGAPAPGTVGEYMLTITASNGVHPNATKDFLLIVAAPPVITSANTATFTVGTAGSFTVTTDGSTATFTLAGTLPGGLTFTDNDDGTATLAGTPAAGTQGSYALLITASTGVPPDAIQPFILIVSGPALAPTITSVNTTTFSTGSPGSFMVETKGWPLPTLSETGALPGGVTFTDNGNGTATLAGTPTAGGSFTFTITAASTAGTITQNFTLTVNAAPTVTTHPSNQTVAEGQTATFTAAANGDPVPTVQWQLSTNGGSTFTNITGATAASFTTAATTTAVNGYQYRAVFTNSFGSATSNAAILTVTSGGPAAIVSPAPGSTLTSSTVTFTWTAAMGATSYQVWVGTTLGAHDLGVGSTTGLSATISNLPINGIPLFVRMHTLVGSTWTSRDYTYTAATVSIAALTSPVSGSTLTGSTVTFTWTAAAGATSYQVWVGSTLGTHDLGVGSTTGLSATISNLPTNGIPLFVRMFTLSGGTWYFNDYTYTAATMTNATITSPVPGSTLTSSTVTFTWTAATGATSYQVWVGSTLGAHDLGVGSTTGLSATISNLPTNGATLYVRLCALVNGTWHNSEYTYKAATIATITSPVPGSTLTGSTVTFTWTALAGATSYQVWVGTTLGAHDLGVGSTTGLSATISNLPTNGATLYVRLCALVNGTWHNSEYTYRAAMIGTITSPVPGSTLTGSTVTFTWTALAGATSYQVWVGSTLGAHDLGVGSTTGLSAAISNLPINGITLYVRLCALVNGTWHNSEYTYKAATVPIATITSPVPGSTLTGSKVTFTWTAAAGATSYQVWVGTTLGAHDLGVGSTTGLSAAISNLPTNGATLFVRMFTLTGGTWYFNDYTYTTGP